MSDAEKQSNTKSEHQRNIYSLMGEHPVITHAGPYVQQSKLLSRREDARAMSSRFGEGSYDGTPTERDENLDSTNVRMMVSS